MQIKAYQSPLVRVNDDLWQVLEATLPSELPERCVVAITSKIVALCQGRAEKMPKDEEKLRQRKEELIKAEADWWILGAQTTHFYLTLKDHNLVPSSGIDESNTDDYFLFWPENSQGVAQEIWQWLRQKYGVKEVGVIITDSHTIMLKRGVIGIALAWCGLASLRSKIGEKDLFGREFKVTTINDPETLAIAAVYEMGETSERTPVAIVSDLGQVQWQDRPPTPEELRDSYVEPVDDLYGKLLKSVQWQPGGGRNMLSVKWGDDGASPLFAQKKSK